MLIKTNIILVTKEGRRVKVEVYGSHEDRLHLDYPEYVDAPDEVVPEEVVNQLEEDCAQEIYDAWYQMACDLGEADYYSRKEDDYFESWKDKYEH